MHLYNNYNGFLVEDTEKLFDVSNRGFKYGDALFETIRVANGKILFWDYHYERLQHTLDFLGFDSTGQDKTFWESQLKKVFIRNNFPDARLRLTVYRDSKGAYTPQRNKTGFIIEGTPLDKSIYEINAKGLEVGIYSEVVRSRQKISNLKTTNSLNYILAGMYAEKNTFDEVLILNDAGRISEATSANVFLVIGDQIITPSLDEGCVNGVMRKTIMQIHGKVKETTVDIDMLKKADELFLTNTIKGIQWISSCNGKMYFANTTSQLVNKLNMIL